MEEFLRAAREVAEGYVVLVTGDVRRRDRIYPLHVDIVERARRADLEVVDVGV